MSRASLLSAALPPLLCLLGWAAPSPALACSCPERSTQALLRSAAAVFEGQVAEISRGEGELRVGFKVVRAWKGVEQERLTVVTATDHTCGMRFELSRSYLVFAAPRDGELRTNLCSGTRSIERAGAALEALGMGATPFSPRQPPQQKEDDRASPARGGCASCEAGATGGRARALPPAFGLVAAALWLRRRRRPG